MVEVRSPVARYPFLRHIHLSSWLGAGVLWCDWQYFTTPMNAKVIAGLGSIKQTLTGALFDFSRA
jgi:hypothetical protein